MIRRHPSARVIMAWYDEEFHDDGVSAHIARCGRCAARIRRFAVVDGAVRGAAPEAVPPAGHVKVSGGRRIVPGAAIAALTSLVVVGGGLAAASPRRTVSDALGALGALVGDSHHGTTTATTPPVPTSVAEPGAPPPPQNPPGLTPQPAAGTTTTIPADQAITLAVVLADDSADPAETGQIERAVRAAVNEAQAGGGVNGRPVTLRVLSATSHVSVDLSGVTALIGGYGPTGAGLPWIMPSDPTAAGVGVVNADPTPAAAGTTFGRLATAHNAAAVVGVVRASGSAPEAGLADGLRTTAKTVQVSAEPNSDCRREVQYLRSQHVTALAVAGPPPLVAACANAAAGGWWHPRDGVFVPPSAAYAASPGSLVFLGANTVLGLPWPTSDDPGARRFRAVTGCTSYAAEVAFAATELAVQIARASGTVSVAAMQAGVWTNDLYRYRGTALATPRLVQATAGGWLTP